MISVIDGDIVFNTDVDNIDDNIDDDNMDDNSDDDIDDDNSNDNIDDDNSEDDIDDDIDDDNDRAIYFPSHPLKAAPYHSQMVSSSASLCSGNLGVE